LGCSGVLQRDASSETLRRAVAAVAAGELWVPRKVSSRLLHNALHNDATRHLTRRESEILKLIYKGLNNQKIADQLFISRETVRWHLRSLYSKIGVSTRQEAIRYALGREDTPTIGSSIEAKNT
jgi:NarL family two-component system response regulator LiaR